MSIVTDQLRPFWLNNLNEISGRLEFGLAEWMRRGTYQITTPLKVGEFVLDIPSGDLDFQRAIAYDLARMSMAAFESIGNVQQHLSMPKSLGWMIIETYYSAFFAAHALLRTFGISLTQLESSLISNVQKIAVLYGAGNGQTLGRGFYICVFDPTTKKLTCTHEGKNGGSHEVMWKHFVNTMLAFSNEILSRSGLTTNQQNAAAKLSELCNCLKMNGCNAGTWLSNVRNQANYKHEFGAWFPYKSRASYCDGIFSMKNDWMKKPEEIPIWNGTGRDLQRFTSACNVILALLKSTALDMSERCSTGKSFHTNTTKAVLNFLMQ